MNINELEEIYIILTEEASREDLTNIQSKLLKYGLELSIKNLVYNYNDAQVIESIEVELKEEGGSKVNMSWTKAAKGYQFMVLYKDWKNDKTGVGNDLKLLKKARQVNENGKLFMVGEKDAEKLNQLILKEAEKAKKVKAAKESNPSQLEQEADFIHIPNKPHFVLCPTTVEDFEQVKSFFKENIFMRGLK